MTEQTEDYYRRRAEEELAAAARAATPNAVKAHEELALHYASLLRDAARTRA